MKMNKNLDDWRNAARWSMRCGVLTFALGMLRMLYYKAEHYNLTDFISDQYRYLINGTYAVGFFIFTAMFALLAVGFVIISELQEVNERLAMNQKLSQENK